MEPRLYIRLRAVV